MSTFLENYLESVSTLPVELQRNFNLMKELDEQSAEILTKVDKYSEEFVKSNKQVLSELYGDDEIREMREELQRAVEFGDEKVALAVQTYELVDKHIRRLDQDLRKFEHELELQRRNQQQAQQQQYKAKGKKPPKASVQPMPSRKETASMLASEIEMPIDPNEPTYCTCGRVSFGEMIGCDNPDCPIEWFHFECVGLTAPVKGKWYCPVCTERRQKEKMLKKKALAMTENR